MAKFRIGSLPFFDSDGQLHEPNEVVYLGESVHRDEFGNVSTTPLPDHWHHNPPQNAGWVWLDSPTGEVEVTSYEECGWKVRGDKSQVQPKKAGKISELPKIGELPLTMASIQQRASDRPLLAPEKAAPKK